MEININLFLAVIATLASVYAVCVQRKELKAQKESLALATDANKRSQQALNKQSDLLALAPLLETEIHLHNFNNKQEIDAEKQKKWAAKNFEEIARLKKEIKQSLV